MKKILRSSIIFIGTSILLFAQSPATQTKTVKQVNAPFTSSWDGAELYKEFCAVCHGTDGQGNGPAASALVGKPTDLTLLARQNQGKFNSLSVRLTIKGDAATPAHGSKDMPVWGNVFRSISANQTFGDMRVNALVDYLQKIQR